MEQQEEVRVAWGSGIAGYVAESGVPVNIPDAYQVNFILIHLLLCYLLFMLYSGCAAALNMDTVIRKSFIALFVCIMCSVYNAYLVSFSCVWDNNEYNNKKVHVVIVVMYILA